jgi:putative oxidoreductase
MVPRNASEAVALILRVLLGAWFAVSGGGKIFVSGLDRFTRDVANYKLMPVPWDAAVAYTVPCVEIVGGICLMLGILRKGTVLMMTGLVMSFAVAVGWAWSKNLDISCGCHGGDAKLAYWPKAVELAGYFLAFGYLWWVETRNNARVAV